MEPVEKKAVSLSQYRMINIHLSVGEQKGLTKPKFKKIPCFAEPLWQRFSPQDRCGRFPIYAVKIKAFETVLLCPFNRLSIINN